jgi:cytochrome bd-type quinol oxidase subunit 1
MYPVFEIPQFGGPLLIASIASFHILPSHVATGAFWMTYLIERKAYKEDRPELLEFLKRFSLSILIFCFVAGSLTGVGIWFSATVLSPRAISGLIHNYVWGWAAEWVFFIIEIAAIYVYYYTFGKVKPSTHLRIGLIYALSAWLSMVVITGILGFMLTPGNWPQTGSFFDGFFNQTYWPQLLFRTAMMFTIASTYAAIVASTMKNGGKDTVRKLAGKWGLGSLAASGFFALWYYRELPEYAISNLESLAYAGTMFNISLAVAGIMALYFALLIFAGNLARLPVAAAMMIILFVGILGGESVRENIRRPYLIPEYMYSNQIIGHDLLAKGVQSERERFNRDGLLSHYGFVPQTVGGITSDNYKLAGETLVKVECLACHTLDSGGRNSLVTLLEGVDAESLSYMLPELDSSSYMPPFVGTAVEVRAASSYLARTVGGDPGTAEWVLNGE